MSKRIGLICVILGVVCILGAVGFAVYNRWEAGNAEKDAQVLLEEMQEILEAQTTGTEETGKTAIKVDGEDCIGVLSVPALDLELPVLTDWSYAKLKRAPCRYYGTWGEKNFVIAAHNYKGHFGRLSELQKGDRVFFQAVNGAVYAYEVALLETLPKEATEEMINGGFDLSLYTCTPGRAGRVTVRCNETGR